jgi:hypothetical protein
MTTMTRPIDSDYRRVIAAKFDRTRNGEQITCRYCDNAIAVGRDFAAVDAIGKWHNVCTTCAGSRAAQVAGLVSKVEALAATLDGDALDALVAQAGAIDALCTQAILGVDQAARTVTPALFGLLDQVQATVTVQAAVVDPFATEVDRLRAVLPLLAGRDISFATSLVQQWDSKGRLSDRQRPYVLSLADKGEKVQADNDLTPLCAAILARVDGRPSVRFAIPSGGHNDLDFLAVFAGRVERHVGGVNGGQPVATHLPTPQAVTLATRILAMDDESFTAAQALYGSAMHHCGRCGSALTDQVSRAQGFGPECVKHAV